MSRFNPEEAGIWPEGNYAAAIVGCESKTSQKGSPMDVVTFDIFKGAEKITMKEYFVLQGRALFKLKNLAESIGQADSYRDGSFNPHNYINTRVDVELVVENDDQYGDQNRIKRFTKATATDPNVVAALKTSIAAKQKNDEVRSKADDDIPF